MHSVQDCLKRAKNYHNSFFEPVQSLVLWQETHYNDRKSLLQEAGALDNEGTVVQKTGAKLRHFRLLKGISQEQLALDCDLNVNTIGMIERGQKNPTIYTLQRICDGLGITLATLFLYEDRTDTATEESIQRIETVLRQLPQRDVERVARIVEELASFGQ